MTSNPKQDTTNLYFLYVLVFVGKAGKVVKKMLAWYVLGRCSNTTNLQEVLHLIPYRLMER